MKDENENREDVATASHPGKISSAKLMGNAKELVIQHNGERYVMRITGNNKLILTK